MRRYLMTLAVLLLVALPGRAWEPDANLPTRGSRVISWATSPPDSAWLDTDCADARLQYTYTGTANVTVEACDNAFVFGACTDRAHSASTTSPVTLDPQMTRVRLKGATSTAAVNSVTVTCLGPEVVPITDEMLLTYRGLQAPRGLSDTDFQPTQIYVSADAGGDYATEGSACVSTCAGQGESAGDPLHSFADVRTKLQNITICDAAGRGTIINFDSKDVWDAGEASGGAFGLHPAAFTCPDAGDFGLWMRPSTEGERWGADYTSLGTGNDSCVEMGEGFDNIGYWLLQGHELLACPTNNNAFSVTSGFRGKLILLDSGGTYGNAPGAGATFFTPHIGPVGFEDDNHMIVINGFGDVDGSTTFAPAGQLIALGSDMEIGAIVANLPDSASTVEDFILIAGSDLTDSATDAGTERLMRMDTATDNDNTRTIAIVNSTYVSTRAGAADLVLVQAAGATGSRNRILMHDVFVSSPAKIGVGVTQTSGNVTTKSSFEGSCSHLDWLRHMNNNTADAIQTHPEVLSWECKNCSYFNGTGSFRWNSTTENSYNEFVSEVVTTLGYMPWKMFSDPRSAPMNAAYAEPKCNEEFFLEFPSSITIPKELLGVRDDQNAIHLIDSGTFGL